MKGAAASATGQVVDRGLEGLATVATWKTVECEGSDCSCEGAFDDCGFNSVRCEADANGDPANCICGVPEIANGACDYLFQHRCEPPDAHLWVRECTCDPALPTDEEPCRYFQEMYDDLGEERSCFLAIADVEPLEKYKYTCS
jgi:hypothetical protein